MVLKPRKSKYWVITIGSEQQMSEAYKDFILALASDEAQHVIAPLNFIVHDAIESKKYMKLLIEGTKASIENLLSVLSSNLRYKISYRAAK